MKLVTQMLTQNVRTKNPILIKVKGIMLHSVGCNQPNAQVFYNTWNKPTSTIAVHSVVDGSGNAFQYMPWGVKGWHAGGDANATHIGIEMTEPKDISYITGSRFLVINEPTVKAHVMNAYKTAAELCAYLCNKFNLNPDTDIISHSEGHVLGIASNHGDPEHLWRGVNGITYTMNTFRQEVKRIMLTELLELDGTGDKPSPGYEAATEYCKTAGYFNGDGSGNYGWNKPITREQVAQLIYNIMHQ